MKNETLIPVCIYCDSTGLYNEEECNSDNLTDMLFPVWIVEEWYKENEKECIAECETDGFEPNFDNWLQEVYTADSTNGLYDFAVSKGYEPTYDGLDNMKDAVVYDNHEGATVVAFTGTYFECRKWAREHDWKYESWYTSLETLQEEIEEVELRLLFE